MVPYVEIVISNDIYTRSGIKHTESNQTIPDSAAFNEWEKNVCLQAYDIVNMIQNIANRTDTRQTQIEQVQKIVDLAKASYGAGIASIKLPERDIIPKEHEHIPDYADASNGWNACLDEIQCLNPNIFFTDKQSAVEEIK